MASSTVRDLLAAVEPGLGLDVDGAAPTAWGLCAGRLLPYMQGRVIGNEGFDGAASDCGECQGR